MFSSDTKLVLVKFSLKGFLLPPVVKNSKLLGHLPLVVLDIVYVKDGEGDGQDRRKNQ